VAPLPVPDDRSRRAGLVSGVLAASLIERVADAPQRAVPIPPHDIAAQRAARRQVTSGLPASGSQR